MNPTPRAAGRQKGVVLIVALVMLLLITIVSLTSMRTLTLQERMASNSYDRNLAFQAAETALREGEARADVQSRSSLDGSFPPPAVLDQQYPACGISHCANGLCNRPHPECPEAWTLLTNPNQWANATTPLTALVGTQPQYLVEYLGADFSCDPHDPAVPPECKRYRVTARAQPGEGRAVVMLQSIYATR